MFRIPPGTRVGSHHDGLLKIPKYAHYWQSEMASASQEYVLAASEELRSKGFKVIGGQDVLFGDDEGYKAPFQLGGIVTRLSYDTFGPLAGGYSDAHMTIEWQLYDARAKAVVFSIQCVGGAQRPGNTAVTFYQALRASVDRLMESPAFRAALAQNLTDSLRSRRNARPSIGIVNCSGTSRQLPAEIEKALSGTVVIQAGLSVGSGVIVSGDGYVLTAAHVVAGLETVPVRLRSGLQLAATVERVDKEQDVALIKLPGSGHLCVPIDPEGHPALGSEIYAIGAPRGEELAFSVTKGIVSGFRDIEGSAYIQTDASLNPGNSGGPLLSSDGRVVGVVSWKFTSAEGLAFGVPTSAILQALSLAIEN